MLVFPLTDKEKTPYFCLVAQISTGIHIKQRFVRSRLCGTYFWFFETDVLNSQHRAASHCSRYVSTPHPSPLIYRQ
jgi:hypothetical protein